jgi:hypothetical protein
MHLLRHIMLNALPTRPGQDHLLAPARCAPNTFSLIPPTGDGDPSAECDLQTDVIHIRAGVRGKGGLSFLRTSPVMAVVGGTHFSVNRDTFAQTCIRPPTVVLAPSSCRKHTPQADCIPWQPVHAAHPSSAHRREGAGVRWSWHLIYAVGLLRTYW